MCILYLYKKNRVPYVSIYLYVFLLLPLKAASVTVQQYLVQFELWLYIHISICINRTPFSISYTLRIKVFLFVPLPFVKCFFRWADECIFRRSEKPTPLFVKHKRIHLQYICTGYGHYTAVFRYVCIYIYTYLWQIYKFVLTYSWSACVWAQTLYDAHVIFSHLIWGLYILLLNNVANISPHHTLSRWKLRWKQYDCVIFNYLI